MSMKAFVLNVPSPSAAPPGALLIRLLGGSTVKSEVASAPAAQPQLERECLDKVPVQVGSEAA